MSKEHFDLPNSPLEDFSVEAWQQITSIWNRTDLFFVVRILSMPPHERRAVGGNLFELRVEDEGKLTENLSIISSLSDQALDRMIKSMGLDPNQLRSQIQTNGFLTAIKQFEHFTPQMDSQ